MEEFDLEEETDDIINFEPIQIKQNNSKYYLNIEAEKNKISFSINNNEQFPTINSYILNWLLFIFLIFII